MTSPATPASHPLVIVGAGPIGLAAAAQAAARGISTIVVEAGPGAASSVLEWGHVRLFSPWAEVTDPIAEKLLAGVDWIAPDPATCPTGRDWVEHYLAPLALALGETDEVEIRYRHRVVGVARHGRDRLVAVDRGNLPFTVHVETPTGRERITARAVIDASGTWTNPAPLGGDGYLAAGESEAAEHITYGIPDFSNRTVTSRYAGKHVAVAGAGASAQNVLVALAALAGEHEDTRVSWLVRRPDVEDAFGGGDNDQLEARGALGSSARRAVEGGVISTVPSFRTNEVVAEPDGRLTLHSFDDLDDLDGAPGAVVEGVDEVIVVTGFLPDHTWLSQVQLALDPELDSPVALAGEIHPAFHSCGSVTPHGASVLLQPEGDLYLAGMKSYGRAPSFLAMTGFEQTRSIVAAIDGDHDAAARVELVLPETGVCGGLGSFDSAEEPQTC